MKILMVSRNAWNDRIGNTWTNFFQDFKNDEFAQIFCRDEIPEFYHCKNYFKISERQLVNSIFKTKYWAGERINKESDVVNQDLQRVAQDEKNLYDFLRNIRLVVLLWFREVIWILGKWKSPQLKEFINSFGPDIIYTDAYDTFYTYRLLHFVRSIARVPYIVFHCDDQVTYNQFSLDPLFWINRVILRHHVTIAVRHAALNYCIIDGQKEEYERIFKRKFKILNKFTGFDNEVKSTGVNEPIRIIYAGNLFYGRWKTLAKVSKSIGEINSINRKFILEIYTGNNVSKRILKKLLRGGSTIVVGYKPYEEIKKIQASSDILLHVESFNLQEKLRTALSFSTKIVDFFEAGKCILAIGWGEAASIKYLKANDAAIVVTHPNEIFNTLLEVSEKPEIIENYSQKSFNCGKRNHNKQIISSEFRNDLLQLGASWKSSIQD